MTGVALLEASGLTKRFGSVQALSGLDLSVDGGQVVAVLGPNGAGKTTFVRMVATLVRPDSGTLRVAGIDVLRHPRDVRKIIGLAGQFAAVEEALTGRENLELIGRLFGHDRPTARRNATVVLELMGLYDAGERLVRTYSGGMRRRVDLGASLVGAPKLLLLDEPTTGLDPRSRIELWDAIRALVQSGTDVLLTTQYLDEADQLASQIVIIDHGAVIAQGSPAELKGRAGRDVIEVHARAAADLPHVTRALQSIAVDPPRVDVGTRRVTLAVDRGRAVLADVVRALDGLELPIDDIALRRPTLDEVFLALTRPPDDTNDDTKEVAHVDHDEPVAATTVG